LAQAVHLPAGDETGEALRLDLVAHGFGVLAGRILDHEYRLAFGGETLELADTLADALPAVAPAVVVFAVTSASFMGPSGCRYWSGRTGGRLYGRIRPVDRWPRSGLIAAMRRLLTALACSLFLCAHAIFVCGPAAALVGSAVN